MSATGRGVERRPDDFYSTPRWCTEALLRKLAPCPYESVLDPCCGDGAILKCFSDPVERHGIELDGPRAGLAISNSGGFIGCADALEAPWPAADLIVTNPPYSLAGDFIEKALDRQDAGACTDVAMLLRLSYLGSQERAIFHRKRAARVIVFPRRPSFAASLYCVGESAGKGKSRKLGCGWAVLIPIEAPRTKTCPTCGGGVGVTTSDAAEYAWFVWHYEGRMGGTWEILDLD